MFLCSESLCSEPRASARATSRDAADFRQATDPATVPNDVLQLRPAFTIVELLVVGGIVALLVGLLLPGLAAARAQTRETVCRSNLRQLLIANDLYATENGGYYVPGAADFLENLHRWHGVRDRIDEPFDPARGPLAPYLGPDAQVRQCPSFPVKEITSPTGGFERGSGGYGYNNRYLGVQLSCGADGSCVTTNDRTGAAVRWVARPQRTVMFTDSAFVAGGLIEYGFAEPRFHPSYPTSRATPSIHFRHRGRAEVGWCDGHIDAQTMTFTWKGPFYEGDPGRYHIGWFGEHDDNRLFDLD
ncbi:MAG: hypothetical protein D6788_03135 [Planctomycetota bacterium]|nr:MAG: hypothetical protein D6788_03135 [Planctomycetota bacterium]